MSRRLFASFLFAAALGLAPSVPAASAETPSPWWGITAGERPTDLRPGVARDEVQQITTSPEVAFRLKVNKNNVELNGNEGIFVTEPFFAEFGGFYPEATAANIQTALETVYGAGNVEVTGDLAGAVPLTITSIGEDADKSVPPVEVVAGPELIGEAEEKILTPGGPDGQLIVTAENRGDASTSGAVTIADTLPAGLEAVSVEGFSERNGGNIRGYATCPSNPRPLRSLTCTFGVTPPSESLPPFEQIEVRIDVVAKGAKTGELNSATVSGGGAAAAASATHPIVLEGGERFGFEDVQLIPEGVGGRIDTQAGSHPFQVTNVITFDSAPPDAEQHPRSVGLPKDVLAELPAGFVGNPTPFAQCTDAQFARHPKNEESTVTLNECPAQSAIGVATVTFSLPSNSSAAHLESSAVPIFNMVPRPGEPARFGFEVEGLVAAYLDASVRTGSDYGVTVTASNITETSWLLATKLTFWGVPGDPRHDEQRGWECLEKFGTCPHTTATSPPPFLVMPTACGPFDTTVRADSWAASGEPSLQAEPVSYPLPELLDGCNHVPFAPEVRVTPDGTAASSPTGLNVDVHVPQSGVLHAESLAQSAVKNIEVALPEGVAVNPSGGDGLQACSESEIGFEGEEKATEALRFTSALPEPFCPDASKIATATIRTPLLANPLEGAVYLATQNQNPFSSLIALYLVARDPVSGTLVKLAGETRLTPSGQIIGTFKNNPELPFEDAEIHFFGGERAPLATPSHCRENTPEYPGEYTTSATFTPWSGNESVGATSSFKITSGPNGAPCPGATLPFSPSLTGGPTNVNAGSFSPLTTTIGREDGQQNLQQVTLHYPPGLSGLLKGVPLCPEAQANEGTCSAESLIGETTVSAGVGSDPIAVKGGRVYLTEHYAGAPFGLSIVNPVKAGPFDLEHDTNNPANQPPCDCVVVRAKIEVDPRTAALTITTDSSGPHSIPHVIDGIPVQIKAVNVTVARPGFTFNPTNCNPMSLTGSIASVEGASSPVSVPFQVTNCATLKFEPKVAVSTAAKTSKVNGASLHFLISYPKGAMGSQSWFNEAKFDIPRQLPARLTTIQKACLAATFESNRAACPAASVIGHAVVRTPVLPVPLEGPVYFVSYGGAKFPDAVLVLDGYGVHIELHGETFINGKTGVTSATFKNTPDVPFESIEVSIPTGPYSEFGANLPGGPNGTFCGVDLKMPTLFKAQNGLEIHENVQIGVTGCPPVVSIVKTSVKGNAVAVTVKVSQAGTVRITGKGVKSTTKRGLKAGTHTISVPLNATGRAAKHHGSKLKIKASETSSGRTGSATATLKA